MAQKVLIQRSQVTATPPSISYGELAYSENSSTLFIGDHTNAPIAIGGAGIFAKLASPLFTGTPSGPTAAPGTNTTQIATTAFVTAAVAAAGGAAVWGGITGTLSSQTDLNTALGLKAPLASPTFTGVPAVPTAAPNNNTTQAASTAYVDAADALKANLASPTFTGVPAAPTAAAATNTTQLATTAFVQAAVTALINASPATLDTLKELADAIGDDPNFATTITTSIGLRMLKTANLSDVANVGTARTNLGLDTMATQAASAVAIIGGTINGCTIDAGTF